MKLKPFECVFCKALFSRNSSLKYHLRSIHSELIKADGSLSEQVQAQLQILREASASSGLILENVEGSKRKNARKEKVHVKCEIDSSQMISPPSSKSESKECAFSPTEEVVTAGKKLGSSGGELRLML